jgi:hypothetical protein
MVFKTGMYTTMASLLRVLVAVYSDIRGDTESIKGSSFVTTFPFINV